MAQHTEMLILIIDRDCQFGDDLPHSIDYIIIEFLLDVAVRCIDDFM